MLLTSRKPIRRKLIDIESEMRGTLHNFSLKVGVVSDRLRGPDPAPGRRISEPGGDRRAAADGAAGDFDEMAMTGAQRVPVYSSCVDPASPSTFNSAIHTNEHRAGGHEAIDDNAQQLSGNGAGAPAGAVEDLIIACKVGGLSPAGHS